MPLRDGAYATEARAGALPALLDLCYGPQAWGDAWGDPSIPARFILVSSYSGLRPDLLG